MDSPWRVGLYNPSSACEVAPFERLDPVVCVLSLPSLSGRPLRLDTDIGKYSTEML
jgi:hypothetical protein